MAEVVLIVAALLGLGFVSTRLATLARVPHSVFLVLVGLLGAVALRLGHAAIPGSLWHAFPNVVLYVLLPPLVFDSAYHLDFDELRRETWAVGGLATLGLVISCVVVALGLHVLLGLALEPALLFGALISATDPVAVVALFREVGAPRRLSTLIEGESLLNDGTAIVLFRVVPLITAASAVGRSPLATGAIQFCTVALGGVAVGLGFVVIASLALRVATTGAAQLGLTVATAYASFIVADRFLGVSGVISTMTVGLYFGSRARLELGREALHRMGALWEFLALSANTLIFLAVGLSADPATWKQMAGLLPVTLAVVFAARLISVVLTLAPLNLLRLGERVGAAYQTTLVWAGLRGGLALALVLTMPASAPYKPLLLTMATAVVLFSLLVNAVTTAPLLRGLRLDALGPDDQAFYAGSLTQVLQRTFRVLAQTAQVGTLSPALLAELQQRAQKSLGVSATKEVQAVYGPFEIQQLLVAEQRYYDLQLEDGVLDQRAWVALQRMVKERLQAYGRHGLAGLRSYPFDVRLREPLLTRRAPLQREAERFEVLLHLELGLRQAGLELADGSELDGISTAWRQTAQQRLDEFFKTYPDLGTAVQAGFVARTFDAFTRRSLEEMRDSGRHWRGGARQGRGGAPPRHPGAPRGGTAARPAQPRGAAGAGAALPRAPDGRPCPPAGPGGSPRLPAWRRRGARGRGGHLALPGARRRARGAEHAAPRRPAQPAALRGRVVRRGIAGRGKPSHGHGGGPRRGGAHGDPLRPLQRPAENISPPCAPRWRPRPRTGWSSRAAERRPLRPQTPPPCWPARPSSRAFPRPRFKGWRATGAPSSSALARCSSATANQAPRSSPCSTVSWSSRRPESGRGLGWRCRARPWASSRWCWEPPGLARRARRRRCACWRSPARRSKRSPRTTRS